MKKSTVVTLLLVALSGSACTKQKQWKSGNASPTPIPAVYNVSSFPPWWWWWGHSGGGYFNGYYYAPHSYYAPSISTARANAAASRASSFSSSKSSVSARGGFGSSAVGSSAS